MLMERIEPRPSWRSGVILRLVRRWAAAREQEANPLPALLARAGELGESPMAAVALDSLLQLVESCLGRKLIAGCCCSHTLSGDERAILLLIARGARSQPFLSCELAPGFRGVLSAAVASLVAVLESELRAVPPVPVHAAGRA